MKILLLTLVLIACNKNDTNASSSKILDEAKIIEKEMMSNAELLSSTINVRGRIVAAKDFSDFPDVIETLVKLELQKTANQLLVVDVGQPALLVTTKSAFETTGLFSLKALKLSSTKTTLGTVPVLIEFNNYETIQDKFMKGDEDIRKLSVQYVQGELPRYLEKAESIKKSSNSSLEPKAIASLLILSELGNRNDISHVFYGFNNVAVLCGLQEKLKKQSEWIAEFDKLKKNFGTDQEQRLLSNVWCVQNPLKKKDNVLSYEECMCNSHYTEDTHVQAYKRSKEFKEYASIIYSDTSRNIASEK